MSVYRLVCRDFFDGSLKSKRYIILIFVTVLQCMMVQMQFDVIFYSNNGNYTYNFHELFLGIFAGCEPFFKSGSISFPYGWFALYCCSLLISFDYIYNDLTRSGIQTLSRIRSRRSWWYAKCIWNILTSLFSYIIILLTVIIFCIIVKIPLTLFEDSELPIALLFDFSIYQPNDISKLSSLKWLVLFGCPLITIVTASLLQMLLSIVIKSLYSLAVIIGFLVLSVAADWNVVFTRTGMTIPNNMFFMDGYNLRCGIIICLIIIILSVFAGGFYFKYYDILPDKEESK